MKTIITHPIAARKNPSATPLQTESDRQGWQIELSKAITQPEQLYKRLQLDTSKLDKKESLLIQQANQTFRLCVTESFVSRMEPGNWDDPLLKQVLPIDEEVSPNEHYVSDPLQELKSNPIPGLLHKYHGRALLVTNGHCAINCRFCFRRNFSYNDNHFSTITNTAIQDYLHRHTDIEEVILSGGDPLLLNDKRMAELFSQLSKITHLKRIRIHSRVPIVLPSRITKPLLNLFNESSLKVIMVIHCNHAQEIDPSVSEVLKNLKKSCFSLLNQSVLLKGVNNHIDALEELQYALFENQVQSYYLHLLDKVSGAAHFDLPKQDALLLYKSLQARLPGYMVPKLVAEISGEANKTQFC